MTRNTKGCGVPPRPNADYRLVLYDLSGASKFESLGSSYYRLAEVAFLVFGLNDHLGFEQLPKYWAMLHQNSPGAILIVVGNKVDASGRCISQQEAEQFADTIGATYWEVSAKENTGVKAVFDWAVSQLLQRRCLA